MRYTPHPYQQHATELLLDLPSCALFLGMGLGKTVATLTAIDELMYDRFEIRKVLVIAPLRVAEDVWLREKDKWDHTKHLTVSRVLGSAADRKAALRKKADIYVVNRENVVWLIEYLGDKFDFDMIVIDELSSFKSSKAKRFRALRKTCAKRIVGLTGTPAPNGYLDLWAEIYLLDRGARLGRTLTSYRDNYFKPGARNGHIVYEWNLRPGAKEEIDGRLSDICASMSAADWLTLPERIDNHIYVHMDKQTEKKYKTLAKEHILHEQEKDIYGVNAAAVMGKLLQLANGAVYDENREVLWVHDLKLEALETIIEGQLGHPTLVFYSYVHDLDRIRQKFPEARMLKTSKDISDWNAGKIPLLVAHPASAGHGLNLQDGGHTIVWFGLPWSLELYQQANARLHRQGQTRPVIIHHILTASTVDEDVMKSLALKDTTQASLLKALRAEVRRVL